MAIALIYHPEERTVADEWAHALEQMGYEPILAPLGIEVGSDPWRVRVKTDLEQSDAALLLMTPKSSHDQSVEWRVSIMSEAGKRVLPILIGEPKLINIRWRFWQMLVGDTHQLKQRLQALLNDIAPPKILCFISYSRAERKLAKRLREDLRSRGITTWRDEDDIAAGHSWDSEIQKALKMSTHIIFIASPSAVESRNSLDELNFAIDMNKVIIPLLAKNCQLPLRIHRAQWVDFRRSYKTGFSRLIHQLGIGA